jgi:hypothetical protein
MKKKKKKKERALFLSCRVWSSTQGGKKEGGGGTQFTFFSFFFFFFGVLFLSQRRGGLSLFFFQAFSVAFSHEEKARSAKEFSEDHNEMAEQKKGWSLVAVKPAVSFREIQRLQSENKDDSGLPSKPTVPDDEEMILQKFSSAHLVRLLSLFFFLTSRNRNRTKFHSPSSNFFGFLRVCT